MVPSEKGSPYIYIYIYIYISEHCWGIFYWKCGNAFVHAGDRLRGADAGVSDVEPQDGREMTPAALNARSCGSVNGPFPGGGTFTLLCPSGGILGRYIIVQIVGRTGILSLCEVQAGNAVFLLFFSLQTLDEFLYVFRRDVLWYGTVRPSVSPSVRPSVRLLARKNIDAIGGFSFQIWYTGVLRCPIN